VSSRPLTHLDAQGTARMVDVGAKETTERRAVARARLRMSPETAAAVAADTTPKAEALTVARTGELIPLCHPLPLSFADVEARVDAEAGLVEFIAETRINAQTGIEMEAMTAVSVAALTLYDMVKGMERGVAIEQVVLLEKSGGASGVWRRSED
jgi:cyclic pyranopterin phosphate synthase